MSSQSEALKAFKRELSARWITLDSFLSQADRNNDGHIEAEELIDLFAQLHLSSFDEESIRGLLTELDQDGSGFLERDELTRLFVSVGAPRVTQSLARPASNKTRAESSQRLVSLVAHNNMKPVLLDFIEANLEFFSGLPLVTTGSTGRSLQATLGIEVQQLVASGPLGGDQAIGGMISEHKIAAIFFFKDPLTSHAHASDIEALTRLCDVHQIPYATNAASAAGLMMALNHYGLSWELHRSESNVVQAYKNQQSQVISSLKS